MKRHWFGLVLLLTFSGSLCLAQASQPAEANDWKPSTLNQPGQQYPQVNSQRFARFRIVAPQAQSVSVSLGLGGRGGTALTKEARTASGRAPRQDRWMKASTTTISRLMGGHSTIPAP